jgi:cytochrome oxidase Cu insertion factor (SCO1/SenC/PrrC family)
MKHILTTILLLGSMVSLAQSERNINIRIVNPLDKKNDSTVVTATTKYFPYRYKSLATNLVPSKDGTYFYTIPEQEKFCYLTIVTTSNGFPDKYITYDQIVEPGDDICIRVEKGELRFAGRGFEKYEYAYKIRSEDRRWLKSYTDSLRSTAGQFSNPFEQNDTVGYKAMPFELKQQGQMLNARLAWQFKTLEHYTSRMSGPTIDQIKTNLRGEMAQKFHRTYNLLYLKFTPGFVSPQLEQKVKNDLYHVFSEYLNATIEQFSDDKFYYSPELSQFVVNCASATTSFRENGREWIDRKFSGEVRDRLLTQLFIGTFKKLKNADETITILLNEVKADYCKDILTNFYDSLRPGAYVDDFSLTDTKGNLVSWKEFRGKTVVMDFWYTGCGGCLQVAPYLEKIMERVKLNPEIVFLSISIDRKREQWLQSVASNMYAGAGAINLFTGGKGFNHPLLQRYKVFSYPRIMIVGKDGRLISGNPERPNDDSSVNRFIDLITK